jgi:hypothetical protein
LADRSVELVDSAVIAACERPKDAADRCAVVPFVTATATFRLVVLCTARDRAIDMHDQRTRTRRHATGRYVRERRTAVRRGRASLPYAPLLTITHTTHLQTGCNSGPLCRSDNPRPFALRSGRG